MACEHKRTNQHGERDFYFDWCKDCGAIHWVPTAGSVLPPKGWMVPANEVDVLIDHNGVLSFVCSFTRCTKEFRSDRKALTAYARDKGWSVSNGKEPYVRCPKHRYKTDTREKARGRS